jgi:hypothetical protein
MVAPSGLDSSTFANPIAAFPCSVSAPITEITNPCNRQAFILSITPDGSDSYVKYETYLEKVRLRESGIVNLF